MPEPPDMNAPVTHGQLHAALEIWGGALLAAINDLRGEMRAMRLELRNEIGASEHRLRNEMQGTEQRLLAEMARHASANQESMSAQVAVVDQKYADLPARVTRLETRGATKRTRR
jgi:hypothetical protein